MGKQLRVFGDGEQTRDFTFVENVVEANLLAMHQPEIGGEIFNIACGERLTINHLVASLESILGRAVVVERAEARPGDVRHSMGDISKARLRARIRAQRRLRNWSSPDC